MKITLIIFAAILVGCQSTPKAAPRLKDLPVLPKYPTAGVGGHCPVGDMDEFHRNLFLNTNGRMNH